MGKLLEDYRVEQEQLNNEEQLLKFEISSYPMLQQIALFKEPYDKLWFTFYSFQQKETQWLKGQFRNSEYNSCEFSTFLNF